VWRYRFCKKGEIMSILSRFMARAALGMAVTLTALTAFQISNAKATTFNWDFQGTFTYIEPGNTNIFLGEAISASGTVTANYVSGSQYLVTSITGVAYGNNNISQSFPLSGPLAPNSFHNNDNQLFYPLAPQLVDSNGLGFTGGSTGSDGPPVINLDIFYGSCGTSVGYCLTSQGPHPGSLALGSFEVAPTPLPSTWFMLLSGLLGLGYFAYCGTKKIAVATA
jgi:hypothetical protein